MSSADNLTFIFKPAEHDFSSGFSEVQPDDYSMGDCTDSLFTEFIENGVHVLFLLHAPVQYCILLVLFCFL